MGLDMAKEKCENPRLADIRAVLVGPSLHTYGEIRVYWQWSIPVLMYVE